MSVETVQLFYGLLAVAGAALIVMIGGLRLLAAGSDGALDAYAALARLLRPHALAFGGAVAVLATAGSLYFSEIAGYTPCTLCWYQRIAMYPLVVVLGVGALRRWPAGVPGSAVLAAIGALIAGYHVALEWLPALDTGACDVAVPCTLIWFRVFGVISLPTLALTAFLLILTLLLVRDPDELDQRSR